jgi:hypothetical protein
VARADGALAGRELFDHLLKVISSDRFRNKQGLGNEVPFFICPYPPGEAVAMETMRTNLVAGLEGKGVRVYGINLYDLSIELLRKRNIWDRTLAAEPRTGKDVFRKHLQSVLDPETHLIPEIAARLSGWEFDVLFLSGVGEVYPFIRSHNVLNNLQSTAKEKPTVMFFPGEYTQGDAGASLDLFGRLRDDKYYRAFDIRNYKV